MRVTRFDLETPYYHHRLLRDGSQIDTTSTCSFAIIVGDLPFTVVIMELISFLLPSCVTVSFLKKFCLSCVIHLRVV